MIVYQTDPALDTKINQFGCNIRCLMRLAEIKLQKDLTAEQIMQIYKKLVGVAFDENCTLSVMPGQTYARPDLVTQMAFAVLGGNGSCYQTGNWIAGALPSWWNDPVWDYTMLVGITKLGHSHFRLGDAKFRLIFDPYQPAPPIDHEWQVIFYKMA